MTTSKEYRQLRDDGEKVYQARSAYMKQRFDRGEHPDTHPQFWNDWREPAFPVLKRVNDSWFGRESVWPKVAIVTVLVLIAGVYVAFRVRSDQRKRVQ
jgi:hypothetical protein